MTSDTASSSLPRPRDVYCTRTLNLRAIQAIGYDMDYTLVHYRVDEWERRAFAYVQQKLAQRGWPVDDLTFPADLSMRGLIVDTELGNLVKADRFGYVKRALHGTRRLEFDQQRRLYGRTYVDLGEARWVFLNTFFSLSEAAMYALLVDRLDAQRFAVPLGYGELWTHVHRALDLTHAEGQLKGEIAAEPERYIELDDEVALALADQQAAGKRLLLITNSEWPYTRAIMAYAFDRYMPQGKSWRSLFDLVIVSARKPAFFSTPAPLYEVANDDGLLRPLVAGPPGPGVYAGGHAAMVERYLGCSGSDILYVGDHLYTDVRVSKDIHRWRTGLIVRELEDEIAETVARRAEQERLDALMHEKTTLENEQARLRLQLLRLQHGHGPSPGGAASAVEARLARVRARTERLDAEIGPLAASLGEIFNRTWGPLMTTGLGTSHLAGQLEAYADIYMSRVSNFVEVTPFAYLRARKRRFGSAEFA